MRVYKILFFISLLIIPAADADISFEGLTATGITVSSPQVNVPGVEFIDGTDFNFVDGTNFEFVN